MEREHSISQHLISSKLLPGVVVSIEVALVGQRRQVRSIKGLTIYERVRTSCFYFGHSSFPHKHRHKYMCKSGYVGTCAYTGIDKNVCVCARTLVCASLRFAVCVSVLSAGECCQHGVQSHTKCSSIPCSWQSSRLSWTGVDAMTSFCSNTSCKTLP